MDRIIYMKDGKISWIGKFEEIEESHIFDLLQFMKNRKKSIDENINNDNKNNEKLNDFENKKMVRIIKDIF